MKERFKRTSLITALIVALVLVMSLIGFMVYSAASSNITSEYAVVLQYALASAHVTDGVKYVSSDGQERTFNQAGVRKLLFYATYSPLWVMTPEGDADAYVFRIGEDTLTIMHIGSDENSAIAYLDMPSLNKSYRVKVRKDKYWYLLDGILNGRYFVDENAEAAG